MTRINNDMVFGGFRVYGNGNVLYSTNRVYIDRHELKTDKDGDTIVNRCHLERVTNLQLVNPIKKSTKLNLNRKDNFHIIEHLEYSHPNKQRVLYIHESELELIAHGEMLANKMTHETNYKNVYTLRSSNGSYFEYEVMKSKIVDKDYKIQKGEKYHTIKPNAINGNSEIVYIISWYEIERSNSIIVTSDYYTKTIEDDYRINATKLSKSIEDDCNIKLSRYQIEELCEHYNITKK